ncbi:thermonuclease family protein [candidate division WOR-3 bacterium]|nr:thermonuclease family protein [candidate division WOR-3 bacterium]
MHAKRAVYVLCLSLCVFCGRTEKVTEVIDGDTFRTGRGNTVRLLGINAPEIGEPGADMAKHALAGMVLDRHVRLERDQTDEDDYGRLLRYVFVDGLNVNEEMVRLGYVELRFYPPDTFYLEALREAEQTAIRNRQGLWAFPVFQPPDTAGTVLIRVLDQPAGIGVITWQEADQYYNQTKVVKGRIVASNNTGKVCFLNFHEDWRRSFTAVIFASDFKKFPPHPENYYLNRVVRVRGLVKEYRGKPEIILKSPAQIEIIE